MTWNKKYSSKQVLPATHALEKTSFVAATFESLWIDPFQTDQKTCYILWSYESVLHF